MFERFTESARRVAQFANSLTHDEWIGLEEIEQAISFARSDRPAPATTMPRGKFTDEAKRVWERALREALARGDNYIGIGHVEVAAIRIRQERAQ